MARRCVVADEYDIDLDAAATGRVFKDAIQEATGVPPERQKVMTKGGLLKVRAC